MSFKRDLHIGDADLRITIESKYIEKCFNASDNHESLCSMCSSGMLRRNPLEVRVTINAVRWIVIYPVDSVIHISNNPCQMFMSIHGL